jgi:polar amino acid transport system substrate-binding protein
MAAVEPDYTYSMNVSDRNTPRLAARVSDEKKYLMHCVRVLGLLLCLALPARAAAAPRILRLASLEWLPYVGSRLQQQGLSSFIADSAAQKFGYRVQIDYFPWTRAMRIGLHDARYDGYFPAYYTEERARQCYFSTSIGSSTVGLAYLKSAPLRWQSLRDLSGLTIAVVAGFSNGPAFDALVREGRLHVDPSPSDTLNLRKLVAGRVDAVVIDKLVLRYLLLTEPSLLQDRERILFHDKPLAELPLYVCFKRTPQGLALQQAFDAALRTLPLRRIESEYFQSIEATVGRPVR